MRVSLRLFIVLGLSLIGNAFASAQALVDQYGGVVPRVATATGYYQVKQVDDRWLFVTPEGNGMWMTGIYAVIHPKSIDDLGTNTQDRIAAKYGGGANWINAWRVNAARRLKGWGFNTLAEYQHWGMRPGATSSHNPEKLPYIHIIKPSYYALDNRYSLGTGPVKNLLAGTDARYYRAYSSSTPDVFDPNFESYVDGWMRGDDGLKGGDIGNPWMMGIAVDDTDQLFGFGPGAEVPAARLHPHLGWIALVTNFQQASSPQVTSYPDRKVYTKYALRDFLASRYGTIVALNLAWGSRYTSFDSVGGWGVGTGLLDENGRNPWVGRWTDEMATASAAVRADLSDFLYQHARKYFTIVSAKVRQYAPRHLVFGPAALNFWGGLTRKEILRAAGESLDVLQCAIGSQEVLELTARYAGNKPLVSWDAFVSNPDSALWRYANPADLPGGGGLDTRQEARGQLYAENVDRLFNAVTSAGIHPVAGSKLWSWTDNWPEKANFGVVSFSDNAYDGKEAIRAQGNDSSGFPTGGEENDYGDFLTAVSAAHGEVRRALAVGATTHPSISISDTAVVEGASGTITATFIVSLNRASSQAVTVAWTTADSTATSPSDYTVASGSVAFAIGETLKPVTVAVKGDTLDEADEVFYVFLSNSTGATIADNEGRSAITDDDQSAISVSDASVVEGASGSNVVTFVVSLSTPSATTVTVPYSTANGTATAGSDYAAAAGTVTFLAGQVPQSVRVIVAGDTAVEGNETFLLNFGTPLNAVVADGQGVGTIVNDDPSGAQVSEIYRLRHPSIGAYLFTIYPTERDAAAAQFGYLYEGICCGWYNTAAGDGRAPLFRLYSAGAGEYFFTIFASERDSAVAQYGYVYEGVAAYCHEASSPAAPRPWFRLRHGNKHFYTVYAEERDTAVSQLGYVYEGISCYLPPP